MTTREQALLNVSRDALRYLHNKLRGTGLGGQYDDITIARTLDRVLKEYADVPPVRITDRDYPVPTFDTGAREELFNRR